MRIDILTVMPEMLDGSLNCSILGRAQQKGLAEICVHNLRDYTTNKHRKVDDYPFGGEAGMVMQIQPVDACISALKAQRDYDEVIFTAPDGELLTQPMANSLSLLNNIIILCGHYKGIDQRIRDHLVTREISIGDYCRQLSSPTPLCDSYPAPWVTNSRRCLIPFRTICSALPSIHAPQYTMVGKCPLCSFQVMRQT